MAESLPLIILAVLVFIFALIVAALINSALSGIYAAALYQYAMTGEADGFFRKDLVEAAFRQK